MEECLNDLLAQKIQVVEFRAQLNHAQQVLEAMRGLDPGQSRWPQRLMVALEDVGQALAILEDFWSEAKLSDLDQAVVKLRSSHYAIQEALGPAPPLDTPTFSPETIVQVQRWNEVTRAVFRCTACGWELGYSREIESDDFLDVYLEEFECPICPAQ